MAEHSRCDRPAGCAHVAERGEIQIIFGTRKLRIKHMSDDDGHHGQSRDSLAGEQPKQVAGKDEIVQVE